MSNQKILVSLMALGIMAGTNAFASRATTLVNGTGDAGAVLNGGSFFYEDSDNMYYNPAYVNDYKNWATIERSNFPGNTAQGGFVSSFGNFNFGMYLNRGDAVVSFPGFGTPPGSGGPGAAFIHQGANGIGAAATSYQVAPIRPIELYFGGDMGMKWGLGLTYAGNHTGAGDSSYVALSIGAEIAGLDPFFSIAPVAKELGGDTSHSWWRGGLRYHFGEWTPYAAIIRNSTKSTANPATEVNEMNIGAGLGRSTKLAEGVRMNYAVSYFNVTDKVVVSDQKATHDLLPIDLSLEGEALSWLTLRAGLSYHLVDRYAGNTTVGDNTTGRMGGTVHFTKNTHMDFAVGTSGAGVTNETAGTADQQELGFNTGLLTAASFTYTW